MLTGIEGAGKGVESAPDLQIESYQSTFKVDHSTESALLRVLIDVLRSIDDGKSVILLMRDLQAAFDTVDHQTLLHRLRNRFGIQGVACSVVHIVPSRKKTVCIHWK